jgi:S-adenosylmethionine decarboxylase proenzyme
VFVDMWDTLNLNSPDALERGLREAVDAIDGTLMDVRVHTFPIHGVTGVAVIAESHIAVHTWPEYGYAAVDIFTCNLAANVQAGIDALARHLLPGHIVTHEVARGERPAAVCTQERRR